MPVMHYSYFTVSIQPLVVVSPNGGTVAGSFVAISVAYELIQTPDPTPFDNNVNIVDSVFKGLLELRPGLLTLQEHYEYAHLLLDSVLYGDYSNQFQQPTSTEATDSSIVAVVESENSISKKSGKSFFRRRKSNGEFIQLLSSEG